MTSWKKTLVAFAAPFVLVVVVLAAAAWWIEKSSSDALVADLAKLPANKVGLVLGCAPYLRSGGPNLFYKHRMEAAAELFRAGKVSHLLVSGDNRTKGYDEPTAMKKSLVALGVPSERVVCDYAGFSTFESMIRAREVFLLKRFTVITQRDHALRAVYIGRGLGLDVVAYPARDVGSQAGLRTHTREALARIRALFDMHVFPRESRFLGDPVNIGNDA